MRAKWPHLIALFFFSLFIPMKQGCDPSCNSDFCFLQNDNSSCYLCNPVLNAPVQLKPGDPMIECQSIIEGVMSCQNFTYERLSLISGQNRTLLNVAGFDPEGWRSTGNCISLEECSSPSLIIPIEGNYDHYISPYENKMPHCIRKIPFLPILYSQRQVNIFFGLPVMLPNYRKYTNLCTGLLITKDGKTLLGIPIEYLYCVLINPENMLIFIKDSTLLFNQPGNSSYPPKSKYK